jgi:hypothetical protein
MVYFQIQILNSVSKSATMVHLDILEDAFLIARLPLTMYIRATKDLSVFLQLTVQMVLMVILSFTNVLNFVQLSLELLQMMQQKNVFQPAILLYLPIT